ncbi:MAG: class I SAM-dependent methyltransferase [Firmicutes bacterium]|nr:class I SAM-dependent methyltransferase [Bacillota bacterium]
MVVTTSRQATPEQERLARELAARLGLEFRQRRGAWRQLGASAALVVTRERLVIQSPAGEIFFHPGMARPRIRQLERGKPDVMVEAMDLGPKDSVLDCTLGLGADAIVASYVVGEAGRVVGLETVPVLAELVRRGFREHDPGHAGTRAAMRRIEVVTADFRDYLAQLPAGSFDVVYFDPMFRDPVMESASMRPWRELACHRPLSPEDIALARRVARRRVVVKERACSPVFEELGLSTVTGGRRSRVAYGAVPGLGTVSACRAGSEAGRASEHGAPGSREGARS